MLVGNDRDWSNMVLDNPMKKENCEKETLKMLVCFAHTELLLPFLQLANFHYCFHNNIERELHHSLCHTSKKM
jgi:hypothetical protein